MKKMLPPRLKKFSKLTEKLTTKIILVASFFLLIGGYTFYRTKDILSGPAIVLTTPENYATLDQPLVTIAGQAKRVSDIFLNGRRIYADLEGKFEEKLLLASGYNIIKLEAKDKFGRQTDKLLELVYKDKR